MAGCTTLANARPRRVLQRVDPAHTLGAHRFPPDVYFTNLKQPSGTSEVAVRPSSQGCTGLSNGRTTVLVVEDEFLIRLNAVSIVEDCGFEAVEASNADQAIRILEADTNIRLVFTDIDMPGTMDGLKLAHYIRERWPPILLLLASGKAIVEEAQLPSGAKFFSKPYSDHAIAATLTEMMDSVRAT